jgi:hypothetical protein
MFYCSWKYWHASKLHVQALGLVVAYDMYREVVEEGFASFGFETKEEATKKCMLDFHTFRDRLSLQGLHYKPEDTKYPGDSRMRVNTKKGISGTEVKKRTGHRILTMLLFVKGSLQRNNSRMRRKGRTQDFVGT